MVLDPSTQKLIGGGSPFELVSVKSEHRDVRVYRHAPDTLPELYRRALKKNERELIVFGQTRRTFKQSHAVAERIAAMLGMKHSIGPGSRVAVVTDGTPEWLEIFLAITLLGAVPVLIGRRKARQVEYCIELARCVLVIADGAYTAPSAADGQPGWIDVRELIAAAARMQLQLLSRHAPASSHEAVVMFTSGSTGQPKAVSLSHRNVISGLMNMMLGGALAALDDRDRAQVTAKLPPCALIHTPLCYIGGVSAVLMAIMNGTRIVVTDEWNIDAVCALVEAENVTSLPHLGRSQLEALLSRETMIHRLSSIGLHGASVPRNLIEQIAANAPALKIVSGYGLTETSGSIAVISGSTLRRRPGSSGRIVPTLDVRIDTSNVDAAASEESGEMFVSGACVMRGYLQEGQASEVDWFNTGDVAHIAEDGHVYVDYRSSESSFIGDSRFNSAAVERNLEDLDGVTEASVLSSTEREQLCLDVAVAIRPGCTVERAQIEQAMARLVEAPGSVRIHFCESLPRTPSGKVDRATLRALLANAEGVSSATQLAVS
jgi:acyl-CoA synthetase (AMP-forming)/AMP-acid ligase II